MKTPRSNIFLFRISLAAVVCGILILATTPHSVPVASHINDKLNHIFAFFILAFLADFSFPGNKFYLAVFLPLMGYGLLIENIQYFLQYRMFSFFDLAADAFGILLYKIAYPLVRKGADAVFNKK